MKRKAIVKILALSKRSIWKRAYYDKFLNKTYVAEIDDIRANRGPWYGLTIYREDNEGLYDFPFLIDKVDVFPVKFKILKELEETV